MNATSATFARGVNEMETTRLAAATSRMVKPPRVKDAPCALECKWPQTIRLHDLEGRVTDRYVRVRPSGRRLHRGYLHQGRQARHRGNAPDRARG
jgi:flavin reductase (DIM6/NTAB) family NADH-FMN oxidoreductase RutF